MGIPEDWPSVIVRPVAPEAFDHDDFAALVSAVMGETGLMADRVDIRLGYLYGDYWPPEWTWVEFVLREGAEALVDAVAAAILVWGAEWLRKKRATGADGPPIKAQIYGPDGEILREVEVPEADYAGG